MATVTNTTRVETDTTTKKQGKSWTNHKTFDSFEKADQERNKLLEEGSFEAKVKRRGNDKFVVKTRKTKKK